MSFSHTLFTSFIPSPSFELIHAFSALHLPLLCFPSHSLLYLPLSNSFPFILSSHFLPPCSDSFTPSLPSIFLLSTFFSHCLPTYLRICLSIHPSIHLSISLSINLSIYLFIYPAVCLSVCLSINPSIHQLIYPSINVSIYQLIHLYIH